MYLYLSLLVLILGVVYFTFFINRFLRKILGIHTVPLHILLIGIIVLVLSIPARNVLDLYSVIYYHLLVISLLLELINFGLKRFSNYQFVFQSGILSIISTALVIGYGYYNINHVVKTEYTLASNKIDNFRIIALADLHMGTSIDTDELKEYCQDISKLNGDIIVLVGDIFDENTTFDTMKKTCQVLSTIKNKQGIYYVYGNHDNNYYTDMNYGRDDIKNALKTNQINVLEDEVICLENINIIGRKDASFFGDNPRLSSEELFSKIPTINKDNFTVLLDHQPLDLNENAKLKIDLQLSGHTHGGQLFPMSIIQSLTSDTLIYGLRQIDNFNAITTSGMSGWRYPIKTGAKSEYVVIDIK